MKWTVSKEGLQHGLKRKYSLGQWMSEKDLGWKHLGERTAGDQWGWVPGDHYWKQQGLRGSSRGILACNLCWYRMQSRYEWYKSCDGSSVSFWKDESRRRMHTSPGTKLLGVICTIPNRSASEQNWRGWGAAIETVARTEVRRATLENFIFLFGEVGTEWNGV